MRIRRRGFALSDIDMTPMIDMTFQLIAFFMFAINFTNDMAHEMIRLPTAVARPVPEASVRRLVLNVGEDGTLFIPGEPNLHDAANIGPIKDYLIREARLIGQQMRQLGLEGERLRATVVIRAHESADYGPVQDLIRFCRESGFGEYSLRTVLIDERRQ